MFCLHCGTENADDSKFCKECGAGIVEKKRAAVGADRKLAPHIAEELGASEPANPQIQRLLEMAFWHNQTGNIPAAILACEAALIIDPESTTALSLLGCLYEKQGAVDKAIYAFERVVELNPDSEADQDKLAALKRGEYLRPLLQPIKYRWMPPALVTMMRDSKRVRGAAAIAVAVIVFAGGTFLVLHAHSGSGSRLASGDASVSTPMVTLPEAMPRVAGPTQGSAPVQTASPAPIRGAAPTPASQQYAAQPQQVASAAPQNLTAPPTPAYPVSEWQPQPRPSYQSTPVPTISQAASADPSAPAAEAVKPIIPSSTELSSAVQVVDSAPVPHHTLVVAGTAGGPAPVSDDGSGSSQSAAAPVQDSGPPPPAQQISIHIHGEPDSGTASDIPANDSDAQVAGAATTVVSKGAGLQNKALGLQQSGQYLSAAHLYNKAIAAYKEQIKAGQSVDEARRGIAACQTGLQICQSSE